ncbi:MAG: hypothetical protein RJB13_2039 [Pseudomonadota bacterium]
MKKFIYCVSLLSAFSVVACQKSQSELDSKRSEDVERLSPSEERLIKQVEGLREVGGKLLCTGLDFSSLKFYRTLAEFEKGDLKSLVIKGYFNEKDPKQVPNELSADFENYKIFEFDLLKSALNREVDLKGKKFGVEIFTALNNQARKIYDLRFSPQDDKYEPNMTMLKGTLDFKNIESAIDIDELSVGCVVIAQ